MTVIVVGAGIAGLACARELIDAGVPARVVERARVVGGRMASKRFDDRYADIGAAYLTADHPAFQGRLESWRIAGLAHPWTDTFQIFDGGRPQETGGHPQETEGQPKEAGGQPMEAGGRPQETGGGREGVGRRADNERSGGSLETGRWRQETGGPVRWAAPGGLRSLAEDLARELDVTLEYEVTSLPKAEAVVLAMPAPQAARITAIDLRQEWSPVLTAVLTYPERSWPDFHGAFVNGHPVLATVCDDGDRRGDRAPVLVAHSTAGFARSRLDDPAAAAADLEAAVRELLELPRARSVRLHRWTFAEPEPITGRFHRQGNVYLAGDAFGRPRVQTAWLSGQAVARDILGRRHR